jgi:Glycosyl transferase family 2
LTLVLELERELPPQLPVGSSTAVFCVGLCFDTDRSIEQLEILVDGSQHRVSAFGMPRPDVAGRARSGQAPHSLRSGFWSTVPIPGRSVPGTIVLEVLARLSDGAVHTAELGRIEVCAREPTPVTAAKPARAEPETIAVCMATFEPDMSLFAAQIESLRDQRDERWICLISDDCSPPEHFEQIVKLIGDDPRFAISRSAQRLGFYRNFERALEMVPANAQLIALCDQDDRWHPDKLTGLREGLDDAILVYSDQRLVDAGGTVLRETLWEGRTNNYQSLASVLVANTITGAATLFRRELLELALPFPDTPGFQFHDTWIAVIALAAGRVAYVDRPLYDYVQHAGAVFGDVTHGQRPPSVGRFGALLAWLRPGGRLLGWRAAYFYGYLTREAQAQVALARCGPRLEASKRRVLERFVACDHSPAALTWLALRPARTLFGHTETLGSEWGLVQGLIWKMLATALSRSPRLTPGALADASIPPPQSFSQKRLRRWRSRI